MNKTNVVYTRFYSVVHTFSVRKLFIEKQISLRAAQNKNCSRSKCRNIGYIKLHEHNA
jgi:hypothetical protein